MTAEQPIRHRVCAPFAAAVQVLAKDSLSAGRLATNHDAIRSRLAEPGLPSPRSGSPGAGGGAAGAAVVGGAVLLAGLFGAWMWSSSHGSRRPVSQGEVRPQALPESSASATDGAGPAADRPELAPANLAVDPPQPATDLPHPTVNPPAAAATATATATATDHAAVPPSRFARDRSPTSPSSHLSPRESESVGPADPADRSDPADSAGLTGASVDHSDLPEQLRLFDQARRDERAGHHATALARLDELVRRFPHTPLWPEVRRRRVDALVGLGHFDEAAAVLDDLAAQPSLGAREQHRLQRYRADLLLKAGRCQAARAAYVEAIGATLTDDIRYALSRCVDP